MAFFIEGLVCYGQRSFCRFLLVEAEAIDVEAEAVDEIAVSTSLVRIDQSFSDGMFKEGRRGCHCWELQDKPFAFCGQIGAACVDLLNRVFSTHLIDFPLRATEQERNSALKRFRCRVSQDAQGSVFYKCAEIHCCKWRRSSILGWYSQVMKVGTKGLIHGLVKQTQFFVSFIASWWRNGSFQRPQSFQFLNRSLVQSSPVVMNHRWRQKEYCQNNKRQRWDICEEFSMWHWVTKNTGLKSVTPGCQVASPNREIPAMLVRQCLQDGEVRP